MNDNTQAILEKAMAFATGIFLGIVLGSILQKIDYKKEHRMNTETRITIRKICEKIQMKIAWALPNWLVMWASVKMIAHATQGEYGNTIVPELTAMDALKRWETKGR